jgi:hypothetical protein
MKHSNKQGHQRSKLRPTPQMPSLEGLLGVGLDGQSRGDIDSGSSRGLLEQFGPDKKDINNFAGRTVVRKRKEGR